LADGRAPSYVPEMQEAIQDLSLTELSASSGPPAMEAYRVSRAVNTPRNNRPELLSPVE